MHRRGSLLQEARTTLYMGEIDICCVETGGVHVARTKRVVPYLESFTPYSERTCTGKHVQLHGAANYYTWKSVISRTQDLIGRDATGNSRF